MRIPRKKVTYRFALTLIELLVVVGITGLLLALILPAIMAAREASRRLHCSSNLKQIALGVTSYATACGAFPGTMLWHSPYVRILPFIDQLPLYNSINFESNVESGTLGFVSLSVFICPSDGSSWRLPAMTNYGLNGGIDDLPNAPFTCSSSFEFVSYQHITDGSSTTAIAAEWLTGVPYEIRDARRSVFQTDSPLIKPSEFSRFTALCRDLDTLRAPVNGIIKGHTWANPGFGTTLYNHALLPGEHTCTNGTLALQGAWTASSLHSGGINTAFADCHIEFKKTSMSRRYWLAIGTMNGQEMTDGY